MLTIGVLLSLCLPFILKSESALLRGMFIPMVLLIAMNLGYGGVLVARPTTSQKTEVAYHSNRTGILQQQLNKAKNDAKYYARARPSWTLLTAASVLLFFVFRTDYLRGLSLGLTMMFLGALLIDSFLHSRLLAYIDGLQRLHDHLSG